MTATMRRCALIVYAAIVVLTSPLGAEDRTFDGQGNNLAHPEWGSAGTNFARQAPADYANGFSTPRLQGRPNPRSIGLAVLKQTASKPNARMLSGYVYAFGNLISHDLQHTSTVGSTETIPFRIPVGDDQFLPNQTVPLTRSLFDPATGLGPGNPRQQRNLATAFLDASVVYGSDDQTASILRGGPAIPGAKLRTSSDINGDGQNLLPRNAFGPSLTAPFVAGDNRVNDNVPLTALQTVFMREHNRLVDELAGQHADWSADQLFQRARKIVGAQLQAITYNEFLPALMGSAAPANIGGYDSQIDPTVLNEFPAVFLRIGHSMLTNAFKRTLNDGSPAPGGDVSLEDAFDNPSHLATSGDLDLFLKGLSFEHQEETDVGFVDGMRGGLLDAIDIQRARDHGIPDYNELRAAYGLPRVTSFGEITASAATQAALAGVYGNVDSIDPLVGVLAEDLLPGASVGPLTAAGYAVQFARLRQGDRFWYEWDASFTPEEIETLRATRLADVIHRNSGVRNLPDNIFFVPEASASLLLVLGIPAIFRARIAGQRQIREVEMG
jgi:peroxidase